MSVMAGLVRENLATRENWNGCARASIASRAKEIADSPRWVDSVAATCIRCWEEEENRSEKDFARKPGEPDGCPPPPGGWAPTAAIGGSPEIAKVAMVTSAARANIWFLKLNQDNMSNPLIYNILVFYFNNFDGLSLFLNLISTTVKSKNGGVIFSIIR